MTDFSLRPGQGVNWHSYGSVWRITEARIQWKVSQLRRPCFFRTWQFKVCLRVKMTPHLLQMNLYRRCISVT